MNVPVESLGSGGSGTPDGLRDRLTRRAAALKAARRPYDDHYRELQDYVLPRRGNFDTGNPSGRQHTSRVNRKILNSRGTLALRTLQSGMQAGITSPARPWFRLIPAEFELYSNDDVRRYIDITERVMRQFFQSTGTYNALHVSYGDIGLLGTDAAIFDPDTREGFILHQLVPGTFWLGVNMLGEVDTLYHEDWLTVEQIVGRFVYRNRPSGEPDWSVASHTVKNLWDRGNRTELIQVSRIIEPRRNRDPIRLTPDNFPIASVWWETGSSGDTVLRNSGYRRNPIIASRWYKEGHDIYGRSPGMDALPDVKMLQTQERDKQEAIQRMNRPPMNAPTSMRNSAFSLLPGALNFTDDVNGLRPAYEINPPVEQLRYDIRETEERVNEAFYASLFMMLAQSDRRQITAREIEERHEEKLIGLGPVLELQHKEKLRPLIFNAYETLREQNRLPPTPEALDGQKLMIDYISMLAQAQRAVSTGSIERLYAFAGNLAAVFPELPDKLDSDGAIEEYASMLGTPANVLRTRDEVDAIRAQRAQAQQEAAAAEQLAQIAPAAHQGAQAAQVLANAAQTDSPREVLRRIGVGI